jgi:hypothetical protein
VRLDPQVDEPRWSFYGITFTKAPVKMLPLWARNKIGAKIPRLVEWRYRNRERRIDEIPIQMSDLLNNFTCDVDGTSMEDFIDRLGEAWNPLRVRLASFNPFSFANSVYYFYLYSLIRKLKPEVAVESGVFLGGSSAAILEAMEENGKGRLISVDISKSVSIGIWTKYSVPTGFAVPRRLRNRWELVVEDSRDFLATALSRLGSIDFYLHDSDHTYETVTFEMEMAWRHLKTGGVLVVDDCNLSLATYNFAKRNSLRPWLLSRDGIYPDTLAIFIK